MSLFFPNVRIGDRYSRKCSDSIAGWHLFGKELFIRFSASAFHKLPSVYVFSYFPFGFEGRMWDLIVSVPDHCLSFYLLHSPNIKVNSAIQYHQLVFIKSQTTNPKLSCVYKVTSIMVRNNLHLFVNKHVVCLTWVFTT